MSLKKLLNLSFVLITFFAFSASLLAQTFYVNNQTGNDANSGLLGSPKKTVASALLAAPTGSTISVEATGINYTEANITVSLGETYTFVSTNGTPVFVNALFIVGTGTTGAVTFTGPFRFNPGITLTNGTLAGGNQVTIGTGGVVTRTNLGSITSGQLAFQTTASFVYDNLAGGANTIITGLEFPVATGVAIHLTTTTTGGGAMTLQLDQDRQINGILTTIGPLNAGGFTLTIGGFSVAHTLGGNVTNGTVAFIMTGATTVGGAFTMPNVTATTSTAGVKLLTLTAVTAVQTLVATVQASITATAVATVNAALNTTDVITNSGTGVITMAAAATVNGNVVLNTTGLNTSTTAQILFTLAGAVTVNGNVTNSAGVLFGAVGAVTNAGVIAFPDQIITINGNVTLNGALSGTVNAADVYTTNGEIRFASTAALVTITGVVANSATSSATGTPGGSTGSTNMRILFASTGGNVIATGGFSNSSSIAAAGAASANNGTITFTARTTGSVGTAGSRTGAVTNTSTSAVATNGAIDFRAAATGGGGFFGTTVTQGAGGAGGDIIFGDEALTVSGDIMSSRSAAGADILSGQAAGAVTVTHNISGGVKNAGAANITIDLTTNDIVNITGTLESTGAGTISFTAAAAGLITVGSVNVSAGTITVPATHSVNIVITTTFTVSGGTVNFLATAANPNVTCVGFNWTAGTLNFGTRGAVSTTGANNTLGGALANPTFGSATATLTFLQPVPNVPQLFNVGTADPVYPGPLSITNNAVLPAPYVTITSINPAINANLYVTNLVTFATGAVVVNTVQLDNAWLNVGKRGFGGSVGNFENTSGYTTINGGRVMMSGNATGQLVNAVAPSIAGATFGDFGIDNDGAIDGASDVNIGNAAGVCTFTGAFYLANGETDPDFVLAGGITFDSPAPYAVTVYRTEGLFITNRPTVTAASRYNVTYYGTDKATALEIPATTTDLQDLLVGTTNGATQGKGIITVLAAFTANGTVTVNANQTLFLNDFVVTINGDVVVNGYIVNRVGGAVDQVAFGGTSNISGSGLLCSFIVNDGATVTMSSPPILADFIFGADNNWGGAADDLTTADGSISHQTGGAGTASSLTLNFPALAAPYVTHFFSLATTADANETVTLGSDITMGGNLTHPSGTLALGDYTLDHQGVTPAITGGATITGNTGVGELLFQTGSPTLTVTPPTATIAADVRYRSDGGVFTLAGGNLTVTGDFTLDDATAAAGGATFAIGGGLTTTLAGANVDVEANCAITAPGAGTGLLVLDVALPNLVTAFNLAGTPTITNMTILDNVNLTGVGAGTLVVTNLIHTGGLFDFGSQNIQAGNGAGVGGFTRNGPATYAGTGTLVIDGLAATGFAHSTVPAAGTMTINNLQFNTAITIQNAVDLFVIQALTLNGVVLTNQQGGAGGGWVTVGDAATVPTINVVGLGEVAVNALTFGNANADYNFTLATNATALSTRLWPAAPSAVARNVTLNRTAAANRVNIHGNDRIISGTLTLTSGTLDWDAGTDLSMPTAGQLIVRNVNGSLNNNNGAAAGTGTFTAPDLNIDYTGFAAGPVAYNTGIEYSSPVIVRDVELLAMVGAGVHTMVNLSSARTISGAVTLSSVLNVGANTTFALGLTVPGTATVNIAAATTATYSDALNITGGVYNNTGAATSTTTVSAGGLSVTGGVLNNGGTVNVVGGMTVTAPGAYVGTGAETLNLDGLTATGAMTLTAASTTNMTGDATFAALAVPLVGPGAATINTANDLTFGAAVAGGYLNLVFTGTIGQAVSFAAATALNNVTLAKGADELVTMSGANVTLNPVAGAVPAGVLTLTRGILVVGDVNPTTKAIFTIQATVAGGIIINTGFVRNPALQINKAHVSGQLGVAIPAGSIGRTQWPVGSGTVNGTYRPAAITFTAGNATIAPTTFIVDHQDGEPTGVKNLPLIGGTQFLDPAETLWIGGKAPYQWLISATTSLGASQLMDVELQGSNINEPLTTVNDLRIIRRFDGNIEDNGWFIEGGLNSYSNQLVENQPAAGDTLLIVRNQNSLGSAVAQRAIFTVGIPSQAETYTISGNVLYDDAGSTPFDGATVNLRLAGSIVASTTTVAGAYTFAGLNDGEYTIDVTYTGAWGGPNATDAQWVSQYFNGTRTLTGMKLAAGDVNASTTVNNTDALLIVKRFAGQTTSFAAGDWLFESPTVTIQAADLTQDVLGIMTGDVRGVASPGTPKVSNVSFMEGDMLQVNPKAEFEMPIQAASDMNIGAASIHFNYASDMVELVSIKAAAENMIYTDVEGYVTIAWADLTNGENAMNLKENDAMFVLTFKPTDKFTEGTKFSLELTGDNELASVDGTVMNKGNLKAPMVESFVPKEFSLQQNYPNPFNPSTIIEYSLPEVAKVTLTIYNVLGQQVARLLDVEQEAGVYQFNWNASGLASGMYIYNINVETPTKSYTDSKRMMLLK